MALALHKVKHRFQIGRKEDAWQGEIMPDLLLGEWVLIVRA
jgi:hypothetical protein